MPANISKRSKTKCLSLFETGDFFVCDDVLFFYLKQNEDYIRFETVKAVVIKDLCESRQKEDNNKEYETGDIVSLNLRAGVIPQEDVQITID